MSSYQESSLHRMVKALEDEYYLYNSVKEPSAVVRDIERDPQKLALLYSALNRQVDRIRSRSQSFADGHITVFDKVLLNLFDSRGAYGTTGLCELFVNEYIGINHSGSIDENIKMVSSYVEAQKALDNIGTSGPVAQNPSLSANHSESAMQSIQDSSITHGMAMCDSNIDGNKDAQKDDVSLQKAIDMYQAAKAEYYIKEANKRGDMLTSVRFLRDSAENILRHLNTGVITEHPLLSEVQDVYHTSVAHATQLAGGRKRTFDRFSPRSNRKRKHRYIDSYRPAVKS